MLKFWPIFLILLNPFNSKAAEWNFKNNPFFNSSKILETKIDLLPQSFELSNLIGSEWIWPLNQGGILNRWSLKNPKGPKENQSFDFFSIENLKNVDIGQLSPPEKFDLFLGNSNWSFSNFIKKSQKNLLEREFKTELAFSETILKFKNPRPLIIEGRTTQKIPFGSSDLGALLFASILLDEKLNYKTIGSPCKLSFENLSNLDQCEGINPGSFHILLSNFIALRDEGIILDLKRDKRLELRPVVGYVSNFQAIDGPISKTASKKTKRELLVTTFIKFVRPRLPKWSQEHSSTSRGYESYTYTLELDNEDNIVGGTWISFNRPDFMVKVQSRKFQDNFKDLESIYLKSTAPVDENNLKLKTLTQKEIIKEKISKQGQPDLINTMFEEYFKNYKLELTQKRSEKKLARRNLSKEFKLTKKSLLAKINSIQVDAPLKKVSLNFIQIAESNADIKKLTKAQMIFLNLTRKNFSTFDLLNAGRIAYLQQKYIDDFTKTKKQDYDSLDFIQKYFLLEPWLTSGQEILTANSDFLERTNIFIKGSKKERDSLKTNPSGELKIRFFLPKTKESSSPLVASFIEDVKKHINKTRLIDYKNWNRFLSDKKSIPWSKITFPKDSEELKKFKLPRDYNSLKRFYRLSFSIKRIQALKKVQVIPIQNTTKDKIDYYQNKFQEELNYFKYRDFFKPMSKLEAITLSKELIFENPLLMKETSNLLDETKKQVKTYQEDGERLLMAIKNGDLKIIEELLKIENILNYESQDHTTPLLTAVSERNSEVISKILSNNSSESINYEDNMGKNALIIGIIKNLDPEVLKKIINKGIDFNAKDNLGLLARDYLKRTNNLDQFLESLGAKLSKKSPN